MKRTRQASLLCAVSVSAIVFSSQAQSAAQGLGGTSWQLVRFQSSDDRILTPDDKMKYTIAFGTDGRVSVRIDCNRGSGTWKSSGPNQLQLGPLALTRAASPPAPLNDRIPKDWGFIRSYVLKDGHLFLALMADGGIYEFEPSVTKTAATKSPVSFKGPLEYECMQAGRSNEALRATFYQTVPAMVLVERGTQTRPAFQVPAASGAKYEGADIIFWDARGEAQVT
jgi:heat shock protein HslJ/membrane-bound inhibitor of C-type lysozyme